LAAKQPDLHPGALRFARETGLIDRDEERIMVRSTGEMLQSSARTTGHVWQSASRNAWWSQHREASLNWLALGLLLAAWNASDNDTARVMRRPENLRGYASVTVRAQRGAATD
jgi:hypothetical protein